MFHLTFIEPRALIKENNKTYFIEYVDDIILLEAFELDVTPVLVFLSVKKEDLNAIISKAYEDIWNESPNLD